MDTVVRVCIVYIVILVGLRLLGKREFGQLSPLELVTLLLVPEIVSQSLTRQDYSITNGVIGVFTLFALVLLTSLLSHRVPRVEKLLNGSPAILVTHGRPLQHNLDQERISPEELFSEMHKAGLQSLDEVRFAILEPDGRIAIVPEERRDKGQSASSDTRFTA